MNPIRNDLQASKAKLYLGIPTGLIVIGLVGAQFPEYLDSSAAFYAISVFAAVWLTVGLYAKPHYILFTVENEKIKLKYYSVIGFLRKFQAIEISIDSFKGYAVKKSFLGIRKELILRQRIKNQVGTYPAISISTLSGKQFNALIATLNQYSQK